MRPLDSLYRDLLNVGFVVLRQAMDSQNREWLEAEVELLHNIPSLIEEENQHRHHYFWSQERAAYIERLKSLGQELPLSRMRTFYEPIWKEMESHIQRLR